MLPLANELTRSARQDWVSSARTSVVKGERLEASVPPRTTRDATKDAMHAGRRLSKQLIRRHATRIRPSDAVPIFLIGTRRRKAGADRDWSGRGGVSPNVRNVRG